jgi:hypothetical protein
MCKNGFVRMSGVLIAASTLDIVSVVISAFIPIAIFAAGALLAAQARRHEDVQWVRRKKYDTRLERWQEISPKLNDLLCFFMLYGHFREVTPPDAIKLKRQLDRAVFANKHIFGQGFLDDYRTLMDACFQTYVHLGEDAKIRASVWQQRAERGPTWREEWTPLFVAEEDASPSHDIERAYNNLFEAYDKL